MRPSVRTILAAIVAVHAASAAAREVRWGEELATDAVLAGAAWGIGRAEPDEARYRGDEFPTQGVDDAARKAVHGPPNGPAATEKEKLYRTLSNVSVTTTAALPAAIALGEGGDEAWGRAATTGHALLVSNLIISTLKNTVRRPRPAAREDAEHFTTGDNALSFPSGHSAAAFCGATLVSRFFPGAPLWVRGGAFALAGFTALARMEGDKHYLTDVLVGGAIGAGSAIAADSYYERGTGASPKAGASVIDRRPALLLSFVF